MNYNSSQDAVESLNFNEMLANMFNSTVNKVKWFYCGLICLSFSGLFYILEGRSSPHIEMFAWPASVLYAPFIYDVLVDMFKKKL